MIAKPDLEAGVDEIVSTRSELPSGTDDAVGLAPSADPPPSRGVAKRSSIEVEMGVIIATHLAQQVTDATERAERRVGVLVDQLAQQRVEPRVVHTGSMPTAWVSVEEAAPFLDITPDALRKRLRRAARRDGGVAKLAGGIEGRQMGESWRVHFPTGWRRD